MSQYVDNFIKQHKEYFKRNKAVIESNEWNLSEKKAQSDLDQLFYEIGLLQKEKETKEVKKLLKEKQDEVFSTKNSAKKKKEALFSEENSLTESILGRLSAFIKETEKREVRHLKKTQTFIDNTVKIIEVHIGKCNDYLDYSLDTLINEGKEETEDDIHFRAEEIKFQDEIFNKKIKIEDKIRDLGVDLEDYEKEIFFYPKEQKSSLIMREPLLLLDRDVRIVDETLNVNWNSFDITTSNEMLINMKSKDIPQWNDGKNYWEQEKSVIQFWEEEKQKMTQGININGYWMHPWLYWHLNLFKTPIPQPDKSEPVINPYLRDNEWFFVESLKDAEDAGDRGILLYGTRRWTKSVILGSYTQFKAFTKYNSVATVTGGSTGDLDDLTEKIRTSMLHMHPALRLDAQKQNWENGDTVLGLKKNASKLLPYSIIKIKNFAKGASSSSQKAAGGAPSAFVNDEIGKYDFLKGYLAALPSFETPTGYKCVPILAGTAGEANLSTDAAKVLANPEKYNLLSMDWDRLESKLDPEEISWKRRNFATFAPAQMAYKTGFVKVDKKFGDFLGYEDKDELNKINIQVTNWSKNLELIKEFRKEAEGDPLLLQQRTVQYPIDPEDCFISAEKNIFPFKEARRKKEMLQKTGGWDRRRNLYRAFDGTITAEISTDPLAQYPHNGDTIDAPFLIFEDIPQIKPPKYVYVAGGDFYKQESSDTDSVGTIYIWKYNLFADPFSRKLVASYSARPSTFKKFYDNCFLLMEAYNAVIFPENEDLGGFQTYLERRRLADYYIMPHIDFNSSLQHTEGGKRKYGWTAKQSKKKLLNMFADYLNQPMLIQNEQGEEVEIKTVESIDDIYLLEELEKFNPEGNFDRITACIGSVGYLHYLEKNYIFPRGYKGNQPQQQEKPKQKKKRKRSFYSAPNKRAGFYSGLK